MQTAIIFNYDPIFTSNKQALEFLNTFGIFLEFKVCNYCNNNTNKHRRDSNRLQGVYYYCSVCKKKTSLTAGTILEKFRNPIFIFLRAVFGFSANYDYFQIELLTQLSKTTYSTLRKGIIEKIIRKENELFQKVGGEGIIVQIDETAICRGRIIENPSTTLDNTPGVQWLIGGIDNSDNSRFILEIIPNRSITTIFEVLRRHVIEGSIIATDGYPSYPSAVSDFGSSHIIVPHTEGFRNLAGFNTNTIENLWAQLKAEYRIRRGVQLPHMINFIYEFYFKKYYIRQRSPRTITSGFKKLINILFN